MNVLRSGTYIYLRSREWSHIRHVKHLSISSTRIFSVVFIFEKMDERNSGEDRIHILRRVSSASIVKKFFIVKSISRLHLKIIKEACSSKCRPPV